MTFMNHLFRSLLIPALALFLFSCKTDDSTVDPGNSNTPGTIRITQGVLVAKGLNSRNTSDTIALTISRGVSITVYDFDLEMLVNNSGVLDRNDDIWHLESTGSGTDIYRIIRPGTKATMLQWRNSHHTQGSYYGLYATVSASDSTSFHIHPLSNGHFTIEPVLLPGYYLNMQHLHAPGQQEEFIQGKPQEFWFQHWQ
jgi:hypothetical protein